jgi:recombination protein RecT
MNKPMQTNNANIADHLNRQGATPNKVTAFENNLRTWFMTNRHRLKSLLGSEDEARRLMAAAMNSIHRIPSLVECEPSTFFSCLLKSAELGLYPGATQECCYIPFNNSKRGIREAVFIVQYQGLCQLLYRSGQIKDIECEVVCERDIFEVERGMNRKLLFQPADGDLDSRGDWLFVYCLIRNIYGGTHMEIMTAKAIEGIKARSPAARSSESPWNSKYASDVAWMWRKTALKQCAKLAPKSAKQQHLVSSALAWDEAGEQTNSGAFDQLMGNITVGLPEPSAGEDFSTHSQPDTVEVRATGDTVGANTQAKSAIVTK